MTLRPQHRRSRRFVANLPVACQNALAQSGLPIRNFRVDVAPLRVNAARSAIATRRINPRVYMVRLHNRLQHSHRPAYSGVSAARVVFVPLWAAVAAPALWALQQFAGNASNFKNRHSSKDAASIMGHRSAHRSAHHPKTT